METIPDPFTRIRIDQPITGEHELTDCRGQSFVADIVMHEAYIYKGQFYLACTVHGEVNAAHRSNVALAPADRPDWLPTPPPEFEALVAALRKQAGDD